MLLSTSLLIATALFLGDVIVLKNGNEIQGEILQEEGERVVVRYPGGTLELQRRQIAEIRRQSRADYLFDEGEKRLLRGEHEAAIGAFDEIVRDHPDSARAQKGWLESHTEFAFTLEELGRYEDSKSILEKILAAKPDQDSARKSIQVIDAILEESRKEKAKGFAELDRGELEQGTWRLQRIFDRFPGHRPEVGPVLAAAVIAQGDKQLRKQNWNEALTYYQRALAIDPKADSLLREQHGLCKAKLIEPLIARGDFSTIEKYAAEGLDVDPANEALRYYRGLALEAGGKAREAAEEYLALLDIRRPPHPEKAVTDLRLKVETRLVEAGKTGLTSSPGSKQVLPGNFRELRTPHFTIFHRNNIVARDVAFVAEMTYASTFRELGCATHLRSPIKIYVHPSKEDYLGVSGMKSWSGGVHRVDRRMGDLSEHTIHSFQDQPGLTTGILPHEIAHALFTHRFNYPDRIPLWINEGFAVWKEATFVRKYYRRLIRQEATRRTLSSVHLLLSSQGYPDAARVDAFYGQCYSLVDYLVSLEGLDTFVQFARAICESDTVLESNLRRYYRISGVTALENRWLSWIASSN